MNTQNIIKLTISLLVYYAISKFKIHKEFYSNSLCRNWTGEKNEFDLFMRHFMENNEMFSAAEKAFNSIIQIFRIIFYG